jgi:hypothetical protein
MTEKEDPQLIYSFTPAEVCAALIAYAIAQGHRTPAGWDTEHPWFEGSVNSGIRMGFRPRQPGEAGEG